MPHMHANGEALHRSSSIIHSTLQQSKWYVCFAIPAFLFDKIKMKAEGKADMSFVSKHLNDLETDPDIKDQEEYIEDIKSAAAQIFSAGADTVSSHLRPSTNSIE